MEPFVESRKHLTSIETIASLVAHRLTISGDFQATISEQKAWRERS